MNVIKPVDPSAGMLKEFEEFDRAERRWTYLVLGVFLILFPLLIVIVSISPKVITPCSHWNETAIKNVPSRCMDYFNSAKVTY